MLWLFLFESIRCGAHRAKITFHYVIIDFECNYISGNLKAADDAVDAIWVSEEKLRELNVNERTKTLLKDKYNFY